MNPFFIWVYPPKRHTPLIFMITTANFLNFRLLLSQIKILKSEWTYRHLR